MANRKVLSNKYSSHCNFSPIPFQESQPTIRFTLLLPRPFFFFGKSGFISKSSKRFKMTFTSNNTKLFGQYLVQDKMVMVEGNIDGGLTRKTTLLEVKETIEATTIDSDIK